jgi:hypothetical protein
VKRGCVNGGKRGRVKGRKRGRVKVGKGEGLLWKKRKG